MSAVFAIKCKFKIKCQNVPYLKDIISEVKRDVSVTVMICNFSVFNILYMYGEDNTPPLSDHSIGLEQHTIGSLKN